MNQFTPRKNPMGGLKKVRDIVMGVLYILVAILMVLAEQHGYITFGKTFTYGLAAILIIYGLFRLYRVVFQKNN